MIATHPLPSFIMKVCSSQARMTLITRDQYGLISLKFRSDKICILQISGLLMGIRYFTRLKINILHNAP